MALRLHHLPLLLLLLLLVLSTAFATHSPDTARVHHHHHRSPFGTATAHFHPVPSAAPSMHQNHLHADTQSLLSAVDVDHRLTRADLHRLRPGTVLPTLAGEGQSLVVTHYATGSASSNDDVRINYIPIKEPDVVVNSRIAVHGVYVPFPRLHLADLAVASATDQTNGTCGVGEPFGDCASSAITSPKRQVAPGE